MSQSVLITLQQWLPQDLLTIPLVPRRSKHKEVLIGNLKGFLVNKLNQTAPLVFVMKNHKHYNIKYVDQR